MVQISPPRGSVEIDTSDLADAEDAVKRLINDRANSIFRELEFLPARDASDLVVSIKVQRVGASQHDPNYRAELVATIDGVPVESGQATFECPLCTEDELVVKIANSLRSILQSQRERKTQPAESLLADTEGEESIEKKDLSLNKAKASDGKVNSINLLSTQPTRPASKLSGLGWAGIGVGIVGLGATAFGGALVIVGERPDPADPRYNVIYGETGLPILLSGAGVLVAGIVMIIVDRVRARRYLMQP